MRNSGRFSFEAAHARQPSADAGRASQPRSFAQHAVASQRTVQSARSSSVYRAMQRPPLSALAANDNDHAHVRAVAILGYN